MHIFYFEESKELLDHFNIKQLKVLPLFSRLRRSKFVRDGLPVEQAAECADSFIRNFHDKRTRRRRSSVVSNSNKVIAEGIEMPNYEPINLTKSNCELSNGLISLCLKTLHLFQHRILLIEDNYKLILISLKIHLEKFHFFQQLKQVATLTKIQIAFGN